MSKTPKLRFPEFSGEWEHKKLGALCNITMGQSPSSKYYNDSSDGLPLIQGNADVKNRKTHPRIYTSVVTKQCDIGDIIMSVRAPVGAVSKSVHKACIGRGVCSIKPIEDNEYLYQVFLYLEDKWKGVSQGSTFESISKIDVTDYQIAIPSLQEQQKIASFLSLVDKKIEKQSEKVEAIKEYKKGMMQKIFSREIRFKDDEGKEFPEWEEKKLSDIGSTYSGLSGKTKDNFGIGDSYYITYVNVFSNTLADNLKIELVQVDEKEKQNKVVKGDLLFTTSSETPNEVGMVSCWNYQLDNIYLNSFCFGYRINDKTRYSPIFIAYILRSVYYRNQIRILAQGSTRYNISKNQLINIKIMLPCTQEQCKIVEFILSIDKKLKKEEEKLEALKTWKKGLLQQMFV